MLKYKIKSNYYSNSTDVYWNDEEEFQKSLKMQEQEIEKKLRSKNIVGIKRKIIISGPLVEVEIFPVWNTNNTVRAGKSNITSIEQREANAKNVVKKLVRLINRNFTEKDIWITVGYKGGTEPDTYDRCQKDIQNYLKRLKRECKKNNWENLKYVYTIETTKKGKYHAHIVMNFPDRDIAEKKWGHGEYPQARRLQPNDFGLSGMAVYVSKKVKEKLEKAIEGADLEEYLEANSYSTSRNLDKPTVHESYTAIRKTKVAKIAKDDALRTEYFTKHKDYKKYKYLNSQVTYSKYTDGCYIYAKFKKEQKE